MGFLTRLFGYEGTVRFEGETSEGQNTCALLRALNNFIGEWNDTIFRFDW